MNIVVISHYAGSNQMGMVFRPYYMAREWTKAGHNVTIIASSYAHLRHENPTVAEDWQIDTIDGIQYVWLRTRPYSGNGMGRAYNIFQFVKKLMLHTNKIAKEMQPDVVIASCVYQLDTYIAQRIAKKTGALYIHEVRDMWPITMKELYGMSRYNPMVIMVQLAENSACRHCDYMVSLPAYAQDYFVEHGLHPDKFRHIPNGVFTEEWDVVENIPDEHSEVITQLKKEGKFIICFFGSHTRSYALDYLIEAVRRLEEKEICVLFVGDGNQKTDLIAATEKERNQFIFLDPIPKQAIPALLKEVDALYVGALRNEMMRFGISMNKLFDSMMSGKPIIYAVDAPNNYITDYDCGISVEAENIDALKEGILMMYHLSEEERARMGHNGREAALSHFEYSVLADQFLDIMQEGLEKREQTRIVEKN